MQKREGFYKNGWSLENIQENGKMFGFISLQYGSLMAYNKNIGKLPHYERKVVLCYNHCKNHLEHSIHANIHAYFGSLPRFSISSDLPYLRKTPGDFRVFEYLVREKFFTEMRSCNQSQR